jgi:5-formyltetrahydrofolate cyclo-ligase
LRIAVVFADEVLDRVPIDEHDCRVDLALTEAGIRRFDD